MILILRYFVCMCLFLLCFVGVACKDTETDIGIETGIGKLPNGCSIFYSNSESCCISSASGRVVVDPHIIEWEVDGQDVVGRLSSGVTFRLDTANLTTKYSNGFLINDGLPQVVGQLNGYSLESFGNEQFITGPNKLQVGRLGVYDVVFSENGTITGKEFNGLPFSIDTHSGLYKFQAKMTNGESAWATLTQTGQTKFLDVDEKRGEVGQEKKSGATQVKNDDSSR